MRWSRMFEQAFAEIAARPYQEEMELPTTRNGGLVRSESKKTQARRDFEHDPSFLLNPIRGLADSMALDLNGSWYPVDARWQLACKNLYDRCHPEFIFDASIKRGYEFLNAYLDVRDDADRDALAYRYPDIHAAFEIYRGSDKFTRGRLEGCLLSQHPFEEVATICEQPLSIIQTYENLFFAVRSRLEHGFVIREIAFYGKFWDIVYYGGIPESDVDIILKLAGLFGGGILLKPMIRYLTSGLQLCESRPCPTRSELVALNEVLSARVMMLTWILPPEKMKRTEQLNSLWEELGQIIKAWPDETGLLDNSVFDLPPMSDEQLDAWWNSWQKTVNLAARNSSTRAPTKVA